MRTVEQSKVILSLILLAAAAPEARASWITLGAGGLPTTGTFPNPVFGYSPIPDDGTPITSNIVVSGFSGTIQGPHLIRVRLIGLFHEAAGDLQIIVRNITSGIIEQTVVSQLGYTTPGDAIVNFDTASGGVSGFYQFYPGAPLNLWTFLPSNPSTISNSDDAAIPSDVGYVPTDASGAALTWIVFSGLSANGTWQLEITDLVSAFEGSIQGWEIDMWVTDVPEPGTYAMMMSAAAAWLLMRRRSRV
jgi:hypothetical protein